MEKSLVHPSVFELVIWQKWRGTIQEYTIAQHRHRRGSPRWNEVRVSLEAAKEQEGFSHSGTRWTKRTKMDAGNLLCQSQCKQQRLVTSLLRSVTVARAAQLLQGYIFLPILSSELATIVFIHNLLDLDILGGCSRWEEWSIRNEWVQWRCLSMTENYVVKPGRGELIWHYLSGVLHVYIFLQLTFWQKSRKTHCNGLGAVIRHAHAYETVSALGLYRFHQFDNWPVVCANLAKIVCPRERLCSVESPT